MCDNHDSGTTSADTVAQQGANKNLDRRGFLRSGATVAAGAAAAGSTIGQAKAHEATYDPPEKGALPPTGFQLDTTRAALVVTDPQIDFLSPDGVTWKVVGDSVEQNNTVDNLERLFETAKAAGMTVAVSPHYYYPHDHEWSFGGPLEKLMHEIGMFDRESPMRTEGLDGSGADFMPQYKRYIEDGETIITSPHKVYGPEQNDLVLQLRKQRIDQVLLAGMSANLCVESHLRELLEQGFEVAVVKDATAAARVPEGDGYLAALINFRYIANGLLSTDDAVRAINGKS